MSHKERVAASLEQITSLCFQISGLVVEEEEEKAMSTFPTCISSSESRLTATSPPFVPKDKEKVGVSGSASVLVTFVRSGYIGALTKPQSSVSDKVEASSFGSSAMAAAMQHANTAPAFLAAWNAAPDDNARQALEQVDLTHVTTQLANSLRSRRSRTGSAISVERQVILLRIAMIGILEGRLTRTRSRRRARKILRIFRISRQYRTTS
jgi:hypothetical protein